MSEEVNRLIRLVKEEADTTAFSRLLQLKNRYDLNITSLLESKENESILSRCYGTIGVYRGFHLPYTRPRRFYFRTTYRKTHSICHYDCNLYNYESLKPSKYLTRYKCVPLGIESLINYDLFNPVCLLSEVKERDLVTFKSDYLPVISSRLGLFYGLKQGTTELIKTEGRLTYISHYFKFDMDNIHFQVMITGYRFSHLNIVANLYYDVADIS